MKRHLLILTMFVAVLGLTTSYAQKGKGQGGKIKNLNWEEQSNLATERLTKKLTLNTEQATKVKDINYSFFKAKNEIEGKYKITERREAMKEIRPLKKQRKEQIEALLSADQKAKLKEERDNAKGKMKKKMKGSKEKDVPTLEPVEEIDVLD